MADQQSTDQAVPTFPAEYENRATRRARHKLEYADMPLVSLLRLPAVQARVGLCRSSIYERIAKGKFPAPISLGARAVAWDSRAIDAWIAERIAHAAKA